jgi:antitoxin component YwqK of YwqJK toxin-antitoxin module
MRFNIFLVSLLFFLLFASSCKKVEKAKYPDGKQKFEYQYNQNGKMEGVARFWYENGNLELTAVYSNGKLDGMLVRYREDGSVVSEDEYKDGKLNGISREKNRHNVVLSEKTYVNDTLDGPCKTYDDAGHLLSEGQYSHGWFEGKWTYYDQFGKIIGEGIFEKGAGMMRSIDVDGNIVGTTEIRNNLKNGKEVYYSIDGRQVRTVYYLDGEPVPYEVK